MAPSDTPENDGHSDNDIAADIAAMRSGEPIAQEGGAEQAPEESDVQAEIAALKDQNLRMAAELENTRRRAEKEKIDASKYAIAKFAADLLTVADNFERALAAAPSDEADANRDAMKALLEGVRMTDKELLAVLERHGVTKVNPVGEKFDPNLHQAVAQAPAPGVPGGHVANVAQTGFTIGDRVLRAAMVVVSTGDGGQGYEAGQETPPPSVDKKA